MVQDGMNTGFTSRQKIMAGVVIVIVIFLIYQVIGMFSNGGETVTPTPVQAPVVANKTGVQQRSVGTANPQTGTPNMPAATSVQPQQVQPLKGLVVANSDTLKKQQEQQQQYLSTVNELQMLKLQKDIAETTQAISAAKLATATAERNIGDLFIKQATPTAPTDYANKLVNPAAGQPNQPPPGPVGPTPAAYVVISVSMQMDRWTAVLGYQGKLYNVSVGDVLPADGWTVQSISKEGVILKKDDVTRKISLVPVI